LTTIAIEKKLKFVEINFSARFIETDLKFIFLRENIFGNPILSLSLLKSIFKIYFLIIRILSDKINIECLIIGDNSVSRGALNIKDFRRVS
jgi:hypothetical protein